MRPVTRAEPSGRKSRPHGAAKPVASSEATGPARPAPEPSSASAAVAPDGSWAEQAVRATVTARAVVRVERRTEHLQGATVTGSAADLENLS